MTSRSDAIDRRMRARAISRWHRERESEASRSRRLVFLQELAGHIDAGFTPAELRAAEVALSHDRIHEVQQRDLPLRGGR
jgi:hypothetical protein